MSTLNLKDEPKDAVLVFGNTAYVKTGDGDSIWRNNCGEEATSDLLEQGTLGLHVSITRPAEMSPSERDLRVGVRMEALAAAVTLMGPSSFNGPGKVVEAAETFESYIRGQEEVTPPPVPVAQFSTRELIDELAHRLRRVDVSMVGLAETTGYYTLSHIASQLTTEQLDYRRTTETEEKE